MRRLVGVTVLAIALAVPAVAFGLVALADDGSVSVKNGYGRVALQPFNGSVLGRIAVGRVKIVDPVLGDSGSYDVWGCDEKDVSDHATVCSGTNLRFRVIDGPYRLFVRGSGINLSAVGRGQVTLDGRGDDPTVTSDGTYALNDGSYHSLPDNEKTFTLAAPAGG